MLADILGRRVGIVNALDIVTPEAGDPRVWVANGSSASGNPIWGRPLASAGGGAGLDPDSARMAALGEAAERYAGASQKLHSIILKHPEEIPAGSVWRTWIPGSWHKEPSGARWGWVQTECGQYVPAAAVFIPYEPADSSEWIPFPSTSTGLAAGRTRDEAAEKAALELIERDAVVRFWYSRGAGARRIGWEELPSDIRGAFEAGFAKAAVFSLQSYSGVPTAFAAVTSLREGRPIISAGSACARTWEAASRKALIEAAHAQHYVRFLLRQKKADSWPPEDFADHAAWATYRPADWAQGGAFLSNIPGGSSPKNFQSALDGFSFLELTSRDLRTAEVFVVRAANPNLLPLPGHDKARPRHHPRWPAAENPWPHPLP